MAIAIAGKGRVNEMRLIDADKLPNYDCLATAKVGEMSGPVKWRFVLWEDVEKAPTVDAIPVRHAYFIKTPIFNNYNYCECSNCRSNVSPRWKVCPACSTIDCVTLLCGERKGERNAVD